MLLLQIVIGISLVAWQKANAEADYGVDCSFPVHSKEFQCGDLLGDRKAFYENFMQGCRDYYGWRKGKLCDVTEDDRIEMSVRQPQSMVNYTSTGFRKIRAPKEVMRLLSEHWNSNKEQKIKEEWPSGNVYVNHWESPTYMVSVESPNLRGRKRSVELKNMIWDAAKDTIEQWTGMELRPTSMYGIRIYTDGAVLNPHVDRLPLVSSAIVNVAQDVDEPWPLEVYDRHNRAVNVTMEPGDMVLYESGSLIHGRPFPMKGRYYANIFIHFEPTGRLLNDESDNDDYMSTLDDFLPPYLLPESPEVDNWSANNPNGWTKQAPAAAQVDTPAGHLAAQLGDIEKLSELYSQDKEFFTLKDSNGWQPLHEAVRSGHMDAVETLVAFGADINVRTNQGSGPTPLAIAISTFEEGENHPVAQYLMSLGAINSEPEL